MNKQLYKAALLAALGLVGTTAAQAQYTPGDLVIGFASTGAGVTEDYFVDLGSYSSLTVNDNLSSTISYSTLSTIFGNNLTTGNVNVGVVGENGNSGMWVSANRATGPYTPPYTQANSTPPSTPTSGNYSTGTSIIGGLDPVQGANGLAQGNAASWSYLIAATPSVGGTAANPLSTIIANPMAALSTDGSGGYGANFDMYEDTRSSKPFGYEGYFNLDINDGTVSLTYDPVTAVPEPGTYGLLAGAGLLLLGIRRQFTGHKIA